MANVTYLLGAGASANAYPVVNEISHSIGFVLDELDFYIKSFGNSKLLVEAQEDLLRLKIGCDNHMSIDTYAKMLYLTSMYRSDMYKATKVAMVLFFELHRFFCKVYRSTREASIVVDNKFKVYEEFDKRYDAFIAAILNKEEPRLPTNINIISWNYDYEFEKAFLKYQPKSHDIHDVYSELNVIHKNYNVSLDNTNGKFNLVKLNGTIGFNTTSGIKLGIEGHKTFASPLSLEKNANYQSLRTILRTYKTYKGSAESAISFSWENDNGEQKIKNLAAKILNNTDIIVVIGYSFPHFNREVDKYIFQQFDVHSNRKIFIQDLNPDSYIESVEALTEGKFRFKRNIHTVASINQFYMPYEL